jgi:hypothetical protein
MIIDPYRFAAAGSVPTPHRYWRLLITANDGSALYYGCTEIEMRATVGGADWTQDFINITASSEINTSNGGDRAFDNNDATGWLSSTAVTSWVRGAFDTSPINWRACAQVVIKGSWNAPNASPKDFQIQWSDDNSAWTTVLTVAGQTGWTGASDVRTFNVP